MIGYSYLVAQLLEGLLIVQVTLLYKQMYKTDIIFKGDDGGSGITALTLDMSATGQCTFNDNVTAFSDERLKIKYKDIKGWLRKGRTVTRCNIHKGRERQHWCNSTGS